jgi:hypothetical protein
MTMTRTEARHSGLPVALLMAALILVAAVSAFFVWFRAISIPHCGQRCDFTTLHWTPIVFAMFAAIVVIAAMVLSWAFSSRRRVWWIPVGGIVVTLAGAQIAHVVSDRALLF